MSLNGVWLPIITPFLNGEVDYDSYTNLLNHYLPSKITGIIPLGTTGECPTLSDYENEKIIDSTINTVADSKKIYAGLGGNNTQKLLERIKVYEKYAIEGVLSVCPYYSRPSQEGVYQHFKRLSEATELKIIIYNIPYRTGINLSNETLLKLAELKNIVGVKDSTGVFSQSMDLIYNHPSDFSVLTGEDVMYFNTLTAGGNGGILASAHLETEIFCDVFENIQSNDHQTALIKWKELAKFIPKLFIEPNPAPLKYILQKKGHIKSAEVRLPLCGISKKLQSELDVIF